MAIYRIRKICDTEIGDGKGFHYFYDDQNVLDDTLVCPDHPTSNTRNFTVIQQEAIMQITLQEGKEKRLKWVGWSFDAPANATTNYDFTMPMDAYLQEGKIDCGELKTGDSMSFILAYGTPYAYAYIDNVPITKGETFNPKSDFGTSGLIPLGTPLRIVFVNTDSAIKKIVFKMGLRLPT